MAMSRYEHDVLGTPHEPAPPADTLDELDELDALLGEAKDAIRVASVPYSTVASQQLWEASETLTQAIALVAKLKGGS
jgi:hypothetical protein